MNWRRTSLALVGCGLVALCTLGLPEAAAAGKSRSPQVDLKDASGQALVGILRAPRRKGDLGIKIEALDALAAKGTDSALAVVLKVAKGRDRELRAAAMGSLTRFKNSPKAQEALVKGLKDRDPTIRSVTLRALSGVREKYVVDALIDVLCRKKEDESLKIKALKTLVGLTHQNMGLVGGDWKKWWELARPRFEFPEGKEDGITTVHVRDLSYFGIEVASKRVGFLVDISSSMTQMVAVRSEAERAADAAAEEQGTTVVVKKEKKGKKKGGGGGRKARKIDILKKELVRVLQKLPPDMFINIITFDAVYRPWQKQLVPLAGPGRARAINYVKNLKTGHGTNVFDTLEFALKDRRVDTIYLLTDGQPTRGRITKPAEILKEIGIQNRVRGVTIHCIAFGQESKLLEDLAAQNGGAYRFVDRY